MSERQRNESPVNFDTVPALQIDADWNSLLSGNKKETFEQLLPDFLRTRRWFGGKGRQITTAFIAESVPIPHDSTVSYLAMIEIQYSEGAPDVYLLGLSYADMDHARSVLKGDPKAAVLRLKTNNGEGFIYDAVRDRGFVVALLDSIDRESHFGSEGGKVAATHTDKFSELRNETPSVEPRVMGAEQSNTSIVFGERLILKLFRRVENGLNPDFEVGRFLTEHGFFNTPPVAGAIEMSTPSEEEDEPRTLGILQGFVPNQGDAWKFTLESLKHSLELAAQHADEVLAIKEPDAPLLELTKQQPPKIVTRVAEDYFYSVRLLGKRTAEMHLTLDSSDTDPSFAPETFSKDYQRSIYNSMRGMARSITALLRHHAERLPPHQQEKAKHLLQREEELFNLYHVVVESVFDAKRTRIHGDYHLGQVLYTGSDFVIIDFEGEPLRPIRERRIKRSPLRDVAGMLRSFDYAGHTGAANTTVAGDGKALEAFSKAWVTWVSAAFLDSYLKTCGDADFIPRDKDQAAIMLDLFLLDKAVYELGYEINNRPTWVGIPISGILRILDERRRRTEIERRRVA